MSSSPRWTCVPFLAASAACYTYSPLKTPEPEVGSRVSAQLTDQGSVDLGRQIGYGIVHVEGDVLRADTAAIELAVVQVENNRGLQQDWRREPVQLPRGAVAGFQQRRLSVGGTGLMGGVIVGGLYVLYHLLGGESTPPGGAGTGGGVSR
jgi:hypothetical protein